MKSRLIVFGLGLAGLTAFFLYPSFIESERISGRQRMPQLLEAYAREILAINPRLGVAIDYGKYKDFWGTQVRVNLDNDTLILTSAGPDKSFDTKDDFVYTEKY